MTNKIGHVITANIPKLKYVLIVVPRERLNLNANSRSTILRSEDTYIRKKYESHEMH